MHAMPVFAHLQVWKQAVTALAAAVTYNAEQVVLLIAEQHKQASKLIQKG